MFCTVFGTSIAVARTELATPAPAPIANPGVQVHIAALDSFYERRGDAPLWIDAGGDVSRAQMLLGWISEAPSHGLSRRRYGHQALSLRVDDETSHAEAGARLALDRALSGAFLAFSTDLLEGAVDPEALGLRIAVETNRPDALSLLMRAEMSPSLEATFNDIGPRDPRYRRLRQAIEVMMEKAARGGWGAPLATRMLTPGQSSKAAASLRRRLIAMGDLAPEPELAMAAQSGDADIAAYDERLMGAVAAFQRRHGLTPDGVAGPETLGALNEPIEKRIAQAMLNLERLRWRGWEPLGRRLEVNQAAFQMTVYDDAGAHVHEARVVIGQKERRLQTPEFSDSMSFLVFNPKWTVPTSIVTREILPEARKDPDYFKKNNMVLKRGGKSVDPAEVDWEAMTRRKFAAYGVQQRPGPGNALGNVKFMFPNHYNVYLHDTPSKHLFAKQSRAFSHGCVRVERPFALAWLLLSEQSEDPGALIEKKLASGKEVTVPLKTPMPVRLLYMTAWVDEAGSLNFRDDVYSRDGALAAALHAESKEQMTSGL